MLSSTILKRVAVTALTLMLLFAFGCTSHPNDDQIRQMEDTRAAALAAEQKVDDLKSQKSQLENELAQKEADAEKAKEDKAATEARVANWGSEE